MFDPEKPSKKPLIYYCIISVVAILLFNALVFPAILKSSIKQIAYSDFLAMVDEGKVKEVSLSEDGGEIALLAADEEGNETVYTTVVFPDDGLTERLEAAGVTFSSQVSKQNSPLLNFIFSWVLPIGIFMLLGRFLMRNLEKRGMGGNAMSFGKANAKIYAESETGVTFDNVAGEEEAKEALVEIVDF